MSECTVATFDFGGTNMRAATVSVKGFDWRVLDRQHRPTPNYLLAPHIPAGQRLDDLLDFLTSYASSSRLRFGAEAVVAAIPGPIQGAGTVLALATILGPDSQTLCPIDLAAQISSRLPEMQVKVMNDVSAAGYRFVQNGTDFAVFTLGSGIGLKVFLDGQPRVGPHGLGGELTHMVFDARPDAPLCDCGGKGHLGALASGRAWVRVETEAHEANCAPDLARFTEPLARAVAMLHFALGLERFIFAGGLTEKLGEVLRIAIVKNLPAQGWNVGQDWNAMVQLAPADDAHALIGGALAYRWSVMRSKDRTC
jgi:C7-cyclitol 7-kinase